MINYIQVCTYLHSWVKEITLPKFQYELSVDNSKVKCLLFMEVIIIILLILLQSLVKNDWFGSSCREHECLFGLIYWVALWPNSYKVSSWISLTHYDCFIDNIPKIYYPTFIILVTIASSVLSETIFGCSTKSNCWDLEMTGKSLN